MNLMQDKNLTLDDVRRKINKYTTHYVIEYLNGIENLNSVEGSYKTRLVPEITNLMEQGGCSKEEIEKELRTSKGEFHVRCRINELIDDYVIEYEKDILMYIRSDAIYENPLLDSFEKFCENQLVPEITKLMEQYGYSKEEIDHRLGITRGNFYYRGMCRTDLPRIKKKKALLAKNKERETLLEKTKK